MQNRHNPKESDVQWMVHHNQHSVVALHLVVSMNVWLLYDLNGVELIHNIAIMRNSACLLVNPITVYIYGFLWNFMKVVQSSDSMTALTYRFYQWIGTWCLPLAHVVLPAGLRDISTGSIQMTLVIRLRISKWNPLGTLCIIPEKKLHIYLD